MKVIGSIIGNVLYYNIAGHEFYYNDKLGTICRNCNIHLNSIDYITKNKCLTLDEIIIKDIIE